MHDLSPATADGANGVPHGGDLDAAERRFGAPAAGWLDLSTGISPWAYPFIPLPNDAWARLPGAQALADLRAAAARRYGAPDAACVAPAAGSQALLQLLPRLRPSGRVAVLGPTYGEHTETWAAAGHAVEAVATLKDVAPDTAVVVLTNPNNPDGRLIAADTLATLAGELAMRGGWLVIDEAFADLVPDASLAGRCDRPGTIVLRSFGKFHGLAGLRLGFALSAPDLAQTLSAALGPWTVSGPALAIGRAALADDAWHAANRARLSEMAARLDTVLQEAGLAILGGTDLFRLAGCADAATLYDRLGRAGILVRPFADHPTWLRFGLPPDAAGLMRLAAALAG